MRIGFICYRYPPAIRPGGIQIFTQTLARQLTDFGHHAIVVSRENQPEQKTCIEMDGEVKVFRFGKNQWPRPRMIFQRLQFEQVVREVVKQEALDLVECFDDGGVLLFGRLGVPLVVRMHNSNILRRRVRGQPRSLLNVFFTTRLLKRAHTLVAVSRWVGEQTLAVAGMTGTPFTVLYNGVDTQQFQPSRKIKRDKDLILYTGVFSERKGFPLMFAALPQIFAKLPDVRLRCVGADRVHKPSAMKMSQWHLQQLQKEMRNRVEIIEHIPHEEIQREFQQAGLCVFPSLSEGHPFVVIEAMACGAPVIFMKQGVGPEVIQNGVDGLLCDTRNPDDFACAVIQFMHDSNQREKIGGAAAKRIADNLSLEITARKNAAFYQQVLENNPQQPRFYT